MKYKLTKRRVRNDFILFIQKFKLKFSFYKNINEKERRK